MAEWQIFSISFRKEFSLMHPVILFYNLENSKGRTLKMLCLRLKIKIRIITKEQYNQTLGALAGIDGFPLKEEVYTGDGFVSAARYRHDYARAELAVFHLAPDRVRRNVHGVCRGTCGFCGGSRARVCGFER